MTESESVALPFGDSPSTAAIIVIFFLFVNHVFCRTVSAILKGPQKLPLKRLCPLHRFMDFREQEAAQAGGPVFCFAYNYS